MYFNSQPRNHPSAALYLVLVLLGGCGSEEIHAPPPATGAAAQSELRVVIPSLRLQAADTVGALSCLLLLVTYEGKLEPGHSRSCTLSDRSSLEVNAEQVVDLSSLTPPYSISMTLKKLPLRVSIFALDPSALSNGDICSNQSITALPSEVPLYRVYQSPTTLDATSRSTSLVISTSALPAALPTLTTCSEEDE